MRAPADFYVEPADWRYDRAAIEPVRLSVFVAEQQVPEDEEFDADDPASRHFLARDLAGEPIGTARLTADGRIGRMAVLQEWRGRGVGDALLRAALEAASAAGHGEARLSAQTYAVPFYERHGFVAEGPEHVEVGIPHRWMRRVLSPLTVGPRERARREPGPAAALPTGRFDGPAAYGEAVEALIGATQRRLAVYTADLEPGLLDQPPVVAALQALLADGHDPEVRVVVRDSRRAVDLGHRWIGLGHRRTSSLAFRNPPPELAEDDAAFIVSDRRHVLHRTFADRLAGYLRADDPHRARQLLDTFDTAWDHGVPDPNMRRLNL